MCSTVVKVVFNGIEPEINQKELYYHPNLINSVSPQEIPISIGTFVDYFIRF